MTLPTYPPHCVPLLLLLLLLPLTACSTGQSVDRRGADAASPSADGHTLVVDGEQPFLSNIRQLTYGGENAEGYFSFDETRFVYQRSNPEMGIECDQIFTYDLATGRQKMVSTGTGRTTCSYFLPGDSLVLYASTHLADAACPPPPDLSEGYVWPIHPGYDIFVADTSGRLVRQLTDHDGYDAEATVSPTGERIVFTSTRSGDLELYSMAIDGSDVRQLTDQPGYDGGAFYSWDGASIVFRASRPQGDALRSYRQLLRQNLVRPSAMELFVMDADGGNLTQITSNGAANFAPFWHPDGQHIIFSSNLEDPRGRNFDLYLIRRDGTGLRRVTYNGSFDGFPMFTRDGRRLIFASNRNQSVEGETNLFICDFTLPAE